jgi:hypothetical protein
MVHCVTESGGIVNLMNMKHHNKSPGLFDSSLFASYRK